MGGYTPGPWSFDSMTHYVTDAETERTQIAHVLGLGMWGIWDEEAAANARLIAAAPDLLGECQGLYAVFLHHQCPRCGIAWSEDECQEMAGARHARCLCGYEQELKGAAISRATGEGE